MASPPLLLRVSFTLNAWLSGFDLLSPGKLIVYVLYVVIKEAFSSRTCGRGCKDRSTVSNVNLCVM